MFDILLWLYLANAILLICHEMDSAYWKEWELFRLPGGITLFLIIHFPFECSSDASIFLFVKRALLKTSGLKIFMYQRCPGFDPNFCQRPEHISMQGRRFMGF